MYATFRNQACGGSSDVFSISSKSSSLEALPNQHAAFEHPSKGTVINSNGKDRLGDKGCPLLIETNDNDIFGPETPGTRPPVPRLKRIQEDCFNFGDRSDCSLLDSSKRIKLLQDSKDGNKNHEKLSEVTSKFEWLDPSQIRDANGRRPGNALYDKRTLYIPPDVLNKMSASQKQYWNAKSRYMDIVLFFKVVSYEAPILFQIVLSYFVSRKYHTLICSSTKSNCYGYMARASTITGTSFLN